MIWTDGSGIDYEDYYFSGEGYVQSLTTKELILFHTMQRVREQYLGNDMVLRTHLYSYGNKINEIIEYIEKMAQHIGDVENNE